MINLGHMGSRAGGNSSSSTSNLSALAPPFTVDRLNPKPNSYPNLPYSDSPYTAEYNQGWKYPIPSAPINELSTGVTNLPLSDDYQYSALATVSPTSSTNWSPFSSDNKATASSFSYGGDIKPYYSPYVPPLVRGGESLLVEDEGSRFNAGHTSGPSVKPQIDRTSSLWDVDYAVPRVDNLGFNDGKRAKRVELDESFFEKANIGGAHSYGNQLNQDSGVFNQVYDREIHNGSLIVAQKEDKSCHEQIFGVYPYDSNQTRTSAYISTYHEIYPSALSSDMRKNFSNDQNAFGNCSNTVDKPFIGPVSAITPSPTVVIRPPPATNGKFRQKTFSRKPAPVNVENVNFGPKPNSNLKQDSFETNLLNIPEKGNNGLISSKELPSPLRSGDFFDRKIKPGFGSQSPDVNILDGFNIACDNNVQVVNSVENSSDFVDHQTTAVDSPCWKGGASSQFSSFDIEAGSSNHVNKNMDTFNFYSVDDCTRSFSEEAGESIEKNARGAIGSSKEHCLLGEAKGIETSNEPNMTRKESLALNNLTCGFGVNVSDEKHLISEGVKMSVNDVPEGAVAVHAAEEVLASPASQEDASGRAILPVPKLNVPTVLKAVHNLSELLLFHLSSDDACSVEEENTETIEKIISNLCSCLNDKTIGVSKKVGPNNHVGDFSDKHREPRDVVKIVGSPCTTNELPDPHVRLDSQHMHEDERTYSLFGKKDEKSPTISPLGDDLDMMRDDDMTKAIKKVLEENFHLNEEIQSQALLFKNLWLDAEAKLCSIGYKARFDRMKVQMEPKKIEAPQGSELGPKWHDGTFPKPSLQTCTTSGPPDSMEASVMARFNILKSRQDNGKPITTQDEQQNSVKSVCMEEGKQSNKMIDVEFASEKYVGSYISRSEDETLNARLKSAESGCGNEGRFGSYGSGAGYETPDEFHLSVTNDPIIRSFKNSRMIDQTNLGRQYGSTSDWEHVLGDEFTWKNM